MILHLMDQALSSAGYHVLLAESGWEAIRAYDSSPEPIHLLLTDVIMPDLTGPVLLAGVQLKHALQWRMRLPRASWNLRWRSPA